MSEAKTTSEAKVVRATGQPTVWSLVYRYRDLSQTMLFSFEGTSEQAIERGRKFCEKLHYRFIWVNPAFQDLDELERLHDERIARNS